MIKEPKPKQEHLMVPFVTHQQQIAELEAENKRLRETGDVFHNRLAAWLTHQPTSVTTDFALTCGDIYSDWIDTLDKS
jgi:hypothetical protein